MGLLYFLVAVAVVVSMKFRPKYAGRGPHAHIRAPAYVGVRGLGGAVLSAFLQAATRPLSASPGLPPAACSLLLPGRGFRAADPLGPPRRASRAGCPRTCYRSRPARGAFLFIVSCVLVVIVGG